MYSGRWRARSAFSARRYSAKARRAPALVGRFVVQRNGGPVNHNDFAYYWRKAAAAAGVAGMRFHELRHAYASVLISAGCSVQAIRWTLSNGETAEGEAWTYVFDKPGRYTISVTLGGINMPSVPPAAIDPAASVSG